MARRSFLTIVEMEQRLDVTKWTLNDWRDKSYGPGWTRLGGRIIYPLTEVERFEADLLAEAEATRKGTGGGA